MQRCTSIVVYLEDYYREYINGISMEDIICFIGSFIQTNPLEINVKEVADFEKMKDKVYFRLINYRYNEDLLQSIPHVRYLDLAIVFSLSFRDTGYVSMTIDNNLMERWGKSVEELYEQAKKNTPRLFDVSFKTLGDILIDLAYKQLKDKEVLEDFTKSIREVEIIALYVLTNTIGINGASVMLYEDVFKGISRRFETDLIILPSSINEVLVLVCWREDDICKLKEMVHDINRNEVSMTDVLSDNIYRYSREKDEVYIVTED